MQLDDRMTSCQSGSKSHIAGRRRSCWQRLAVASTVCWQSATTAVCGCWPLAGVSSLCMLHATVACTVVSCTIGNVSCSLCDVLVARRPNEHCFIAQHAVNVKRVACRCCCTVACMRVCALHCAAAELYSRSFLFCSSGVLRTAAALDRLCTVVVC